MTPPDPRPSKPVPRAGPTKTAPKPSPQPNPPERSAPPAIMEPGVTSRPGYRPDIDGLRALSVCLVVAFHSGVPFLRGGFIGVDVFFVISGFLITGLLMGELRKTGQISLARFYARRARRLLPMAGIVLVTVTIASLFLLPALDHATVSGDVIWASLFGSNWHFAAQATDYMNSDVATSPVLHFWSLSAEEQFYLLWPLLLVLLFLIPGLARRGWARARVAVIGLLAVISGVSLALSITTSATAGPWAYFGLQTRAWELGAGAGLALAATALSRIPRVLGALLVWAGLAMIVASAVVISEATVYPGTAALWPVAGAVLVLAGGAALRSPAADRATRTQRGGALHPTRLLSQPEISYVGRISYSWYLWHWPFLVFAALLTGSAVAASGDGTPATPVWAVVIAVIDSFILAVVTTKLVEEPARNLRWLTSSARRSLLVGAALIASSATAAVLVLGGPAPALATVAGPPPVPITKADTSTPAILPSGGPVTLTMTAAQARADLAADRPGCIVARDDTTVADAADCLYGDPAGTKTIVLVGDSHARHWLPALDGLARDRHWKVYAWNKMACGFMDAAAGFSDNRLAPLNTTCPTWRGKVIEKINALPQVDLLLIARTQLLQQNLRNDLGQLVSSPGETATVWQAATSRTLAKVGPAVLRIGVFKDVPGSDVDIPACLSDSPGNPRACDFPRDGHVYRDAALTAGETAAFTAEPRATHVDATDLICPQSTCPAVDRYGTIIYQDKTHITATFSYELWPALGVLLDPLVGTVPGSAAPVASGQSARTSG